MRLRSPMKTFGGKFYLAPWIVSLFPPDYRERVYVEPFAGGASVLLCKDKSRAEILIDAHGPTANALWCLSNRGGEVASHLRSVRYTEATFNESKWRKFRADGWGDSLLAACEIVRRRMSRGGLGTDFAWSDRTRGGQPGDANAWATMLDQLPAVSERLRNVSVIWADAFPAIEVLGADSLLYLDPPYLMGTRSVADGTYWSELTEEDHVRLLGMCRAHVGKVLISCYESPLYRSGLPGWNWHSREMPNHSGQGKTKQRRVEWVVTNY